MPSLILGIGYFQNGRKSLFWDNKFDLNPISSVKIAQDKGYTNFFLAEGGFKVPRECSVFARRFHQHITKPRGLSSAARFAKEVGYPVFVKAVRRSQGDMVFQVHSRSELLARIHEIFQNDRMAIVQESCMGRDYRIVVLDGEVISAYQRVPLYVIGELACGQAKTFPQSKERHSHSVA